MTVYDVQKKINRLKWYAKAIDKMIEQPWFNDCDKETCDILICMQEELSSIACTMEILLDNSELRNPY